MHRSATENSETRTQSSTDGDDPQAVAVFECDRCGARRFQRVIAYDWFGFPICPVCRRTAGPEAIRED